MCIEDIRIGRRTVTRELRAIIANTSGIFVQSSPKRTVLVFLPPPSGVLTLSMDDPVTGNQGIVLNTSSPPIVMTVQQWGDVTKRNFFAIHSVGGVVCTAFEGVLEED